MLALGSWVGAIGYFVVMLLLWHTQKLNKEKVLKKAEDLQHFLDHFVTDKSPDERIHQRLTWLAQMWYEAGGQLLTLELKVHEGFSGWTVESTSSAHEAGRQRVELFKNSFEEDYDLAKRLYGESAKLLERNIRCYLPKAEEQKAS